MLRELRTLQDCCPSVTAYHKCSRSQLKVLNSDFVLAERWMFWWPISQPSRLARCRFKEESLSWGRLLWSFCTLSSNAPMKLDLSIPNLSGSPRSGCRRTCPVVLQPKQGKALDFLEVPDLGYSKPRPTGTDRRALALPLPSFQPCETFAFGIQALLNLKPWTF